MSLTAAGDAMVFRRLPGAYEGFEELRRFIGQGDFRFLNLETTVHHFETFASGQSGGTWFCASPDVLEDAKEFGFNILTTANNHALDYSHAGLEKTLDYIRKAGFPCSGTGMSLADASAPAYLDTMNGRFALLSACTTFNPGDMAGEQTRTMTGRPGLNCIRFDISYKLPRADMDALRRIAKVLQLNAEDELYQREGYNPIPPADVSKFGPITFREADQPGRVTRLNETDMQRMEKGIREARYLADYVAVSIHSHEFPGDDKSVPDDFLKEFAHRCIDAGADAIIGTGPHLLRPIEIYKGKPIFYCLGDFIIQLETIRKAPADLFAKQKLTGNEYMDELFEKRSDHGKRGLCYDRLMFEAVVPCWEAEDGVLTKITLLPVELNFGAPRSVGGWPRPRFDAGIIERLAEMSRPYGTEISINDEGLGVVRLS